MNFCPPAVSGWWVGVRRQRRRTSQSEFCSKKICASSSNCDLSIFGECLVLGKICVYFCLNFKKKYYYIISFLNPEEISGFRKKWEVILQPPKNLRNVDYFDP